MKIEIDGMIHYPKVGVSIGEVQKTIYHAMDLPDDKTKHIGYDFDYIINGFKYNYYIKDTRRKDLVEEKRSSMIKLIEEGIK